MKQILIIKTILIFAFSCGNKDDWDGPNGFGPLDGHFEIIERNCSDGVEPVKSRLINFLPADNGIMYVDFLQDPDPYFEGKSGEGTYTRSDEREFYVNVSIDKCNFNKKLIRRFWRLYV